MKREAGFSRAMLTSSSWQIVSFAVRSDMDRRLGVNMSHNIFQEVFDLRDLRDQTAAG